jgi:hypothetical protein
MEDERGRDLGVNLESTRRHLGNTWRPICSEKTSNWEMPREDLGVYLETDLPSLGSAQEAQRETQMGPDGGPRELRESPGVSKS